VKYKSTVIIIFTILVICMSLYFIPSLKMKSSENRTLATFGMVIHPIENSAVYHESAIERFDVALSDQFPFREYVVKKFQGLSNAAENCTYNFIKLFIDKGNNQYFLHSVGKYELIEDTEYITVRPSTKQMDEHILHNRIGQLNYLHEKYPDIKMYVYYVSQAFDTPWFNTCIGATAADHYQEILDVIPNYVRSEHLVYKSLDDYMDIHYKTDHHWNNRGAKRGYEDIYSMMCQDFYMSEMCVSNTENKVSELYDFVYLGSYGTALGELYEGGYDEFSFYDYIFPQRTMSIIDPDSLIETDIAEMGLYDEYKKGRISKGIGADHYIIMYGTAVDKDGKTYSDGQYPFVIRNSEGNGRNLIITGDSYSRAMRDVLASHFDTTIYLDYRTLSKIPIDYIIEKYNIDTLLISSNTSMWDYEDYLFTFKEGE